mmetsp:Transcript_65256/g.212528  ORF Transcript_65256/g.212528 Transcript_65256/m.212528 type:complete len:298 (-) Transcript_65256:681-1574(-)
MLHRPRPAASSTQLPLGRPMTTPPECLSGQSWHHQKCPRPGPSCRRRLSMIAQRPLDERILARCLPDRPRSSSRCCCSGRPRHLRASPYTGPSAPKSARRRGGGVWLQRPRPQASGTQAPRGKPTRRWHNGTRSPTPAPTAGHGAAAVGRARPEGGGRGRGQSDGAAPQPARTRLVRMQLPTEWQTHGWDSEAKPPGSTPRSTPGTSAGATVRTEAGGRARARGGAAAQQLGLPGASRKRPRASRLRSPRGTGGACQRSSPRPEPASGLCAPARAATGEEARGPGGGAVRRRPRSKT